MLRYTIILLFLAVHISAQPRELTFNRGEKVVFDAWYNWGFIWLHAGKAMFSATDTIYKGEPAIKFKATGSTFKGYDRFFKVRDTLTSVVSRADLKPLWFMRNTNEGRYSADITYHFDYHTNSVSGTKVKGSKIETARHDLPENTKDMLSVIYYLRDLDFSNSITGDKIQFNMVVDNEMWDFYVRYLGKETIKLKSGRKFRCLVLSPLLLEGSVFSGGEGMKIFVTDDRNRLPVYIESKVLVGKVKASLDLAENLKYPLTSEVF